jgi:hypothetical protein
MRSQQIRRFVELLLRAPFKTYVSKRRDQGRSYDDISFEITNELQRLCREMGLPEDIKVSGETVRKWYLLDD